MTLRSIDGGRAGSGQAGQCGPGKDAGKVVPLGQTGAPVSGLAGAGSQAGVGSQAGSLAGARAAMRPDPLADPRAPQMPWLALYLAVKDMDASLAFYNSAFGFAPGATMRDEQGALLHAEMQYKGEIPIMFMPEAAADSTAPAPATLGITMPVFFYIYHDDVDALFEQATQAGAKVEMPPEDMPWGDRMASLVCPNGYRWSFATHLGHVDDLPPETAA